MPALKPRTRILFTCPETKAVLKGYVRTSGPFGADLTVVDPRFKEHASKEAVPFDPEGSPGSFKLDPEPDPAPKPSEVDDLKAKLAAAEAENAKLKAWIKEKSEKAKEKEKAPAK